MPVNATGVGFTVIFTLSVFAQPAGFVSVK